MELDAYQPCPCGSDKKIKFCCSKDLVHDLDKAVRALEGEQFAQAGDIAKRVIQQHGPRPAFLTILCEAQMSSGQMEEAEETAKKLVEVMPHGPTGLGFQAIFDVVHDRMDDAIDHLQTALENTGGDIAGPLISASHVVARGLIRSGRIAAARAHHNLHMALRAQLDESENQQLVQEAVELRRMRGLPTLLRQDIQLEECPPGVPWAGEFAAAFASANRGAWRAALESWQALHKKVPGQGAILRNIAILSMWLDKDEQAAQAWLDFAQLPSLAPDDAIEAVAMSQILDIRHEEARHDLVQVRFPVLDIDRLLERLLSDKRITESRVDPSEFTQEGQPRPKGIFSLLDRPMVEFRAEMTWRDLPQHSAQFFVYGKQTDREACLDLYFERDGVHGDAVAALQAVVGDWLGPPAPAKVVNEVSVLHGQLNPSFEFPRGVTAPWITRCAAEHRDHALANIWPEVPRAVLGGKTPRQAAQDPALRTTVEAMLLNLELATDEQPSSRPFDFDALRQSLGLTPRGLYACPKSVVFNLPIARLSRYDLANASDETLGSLASAMNLSNLQTAQQRLFAEMLKRPALCVGAGGVEIRRRLARLSGDPTEALKYLAEAVQAASAAGVSPAHCYLDEFGIRLVSGDVQNCDRLMNLLTTRHLNEPGIREGLYNLMQQFGLIDQQGRPRVPVGGSPAAEPAAPETAGGGLWTPDSPAAPKQESKLWLPGMD